MRSRTGRSPRNSSSCSRGNGHDLSPPRIGRRQAAQRESVADVPSVATVLVVSMVIAPMRLVVPVAIDPISVIVPIRSVIPLDDTTRDAENCSECGQ
jgi:hypothetical protein